MDKLLELIDSVKQTIPDQTYIDMMEALSEIRQPMDQSDKWESISEYLEVFDSEIYRYLPAECFGHSDDDEEADIARLPFKLINSIDYLVRKSSDLEEQVLWAISKAKEIDRCGSRIRLITSWEDAHSE